MTAPAIETKTLEFSKTIDAPLDIVWSMLTNRDDLCDWLSDDAHVSVKEGGFATFIWREPPTYTDGPHAYGVYKTVVENEKLVMTWQDGTDQVTKVKFLLEEVDGKVKLNVWHKGFTDDERASHYENFWNEHLHELHVQLETGARPEISERVIVGILIDNSEETRPENGVLVGRTVEGFSAAEAGIQAGDIIIEVGGTEINDQAGIGSITGQHKPGDVIDVTYLRDGEKHIVNVTLKGHPIPDIPASFEEMAQQHRDEYNRVNDAMEKALDGVSQEIAEFTQDDNSILRQLAVMINRQRHTFEWLATYANGPRRINPYYTESERLQALIAVHKTAPGLFKALKDTQDETIAMINAFDKAMEQRKAYMWWMAFEIWLSEDLSMTDITSIEELRSKAS